MLCSPSVHFVLDLAMRSPRHFLMICTMSLFSCRFLSCQWKLKGNGVAQSVPSERILPKAVTKYDKFPVKQIGKLVHAGKAVGTPPAKKPA